MKSQEASLVQGQDFGIIPRHAPHVAYIATVDQASFTLEPKEAEEFLYLQVQCHQRREEKL